MRYLLFCTIFVGLGCSNKPDAPPVATPKPTEPTRIILMVGDGMGVGALTATTYAKGTNLRMTEGEHFAWVTTYEHEFITTDSAAAATALATGVKTHFEGVSVKPGTTKADEEDLNNHLETWFEAAKKRKLGTGIVATSRANHATPAAFMSHRASRHSADDIAKDIVKFGPDVLFGAGTKYFDQRKDGVNLFDAFRDRGHVVANEPEAFRQQRNSAKKLVSLFYEGSSPFLTKEPRKVPLPEMTQSAIAMLDRTHPQGWVLMVEGSLIDWCGHALEPQCLISETLEFDQTIGEVYDYARSRDDVLVVVTADHETGGLSVIDPAAAAKYVETLGGAEKVNAQTKIGAALDNPSPFPSPVQHFVIPDGPLRDQMSQYDDPRFTTVWGDLSVASAAHWEKDHGRYYAAHTAESVPLWATGPRSEWIAESRDNAEVGRRIKSLVEKTQPVATHPLRVEKPKNVIVMIADGVGIASVDALNYSRGQSAFFDLPVHGMASTHAANALVTDSPAGATAIATGHRVNIDEVSQHNGVDLPTFTELAKQRGANVGIVTTAQLTDATPAAFYAHAASHSDTTQIVDALISSPFDLLIGGGQTSLGARQDAVAGLDLNWPPRRESRVVMLTPSSMAHASVRRTDEDPTTPTLAEMTQLSIDRLQSEEGFVLMIEGGQIHGAKQLLENGAGLVEQLREFEDAVAVAQAFVESSNDTLLVVTSDHDHTMSVLDSHYAFQNKRCGAAVDCGGHVHFQTLPVAERFSTDAPAEWTPVTIRLQYAWLAAAARRTDGAVFGPNSARFVPVFASGPGADRFNGFIDQPEIGKRLTEAVR